MTQVVRQPFVSITGRFYNVLANDNAQLTESWAYKKASKLLGVSVSEIDIYCATKMTVLLERQSNSKLAYESSDFYQAPLVVMPCFYGMETLSTLAGIDMSLRRKAARAERRKPDSDWKQPSVCTFTLLYQFGEANQDEEITIAQPISDTEFVQMIRQKLDKAASEHSFYLLSSAGGVFRTNFYDNICSSIQKHPDCVFYAYFLQKVYLEINNLHYPIFLPNFINDEFMLQIMKTITPISDINLYAFTLNNDKQIHIPFDATTYKLLQAIEACPAATIRLKISPITIPTIPRFTIGYTLHDDHANKVTVRIQKELGRGAFGAVFQAIDVETNEDIVVKCCVHSSTIAYSVTHESNSLTIEHGILSGNLRANFDQTNIHIYEQGEPFLPVSDSTFRSKLGVAKLPDVYVKFITMRYLAGGDLRSKLLAKARDDSGVQYVKMSHQDAALFAVQILKALYVLHSARYLHMDMKPHNIMFDVKTPVCAKLIDFGLTQRPVDMFGTKIPPFTGGTPSYSSHWINQGEHASFRDDLMSLGYILYFAAIDILPWQDKKFANEQAAHAGYAEEKLKHMHLFTECEWEPLQKYFKYVVELPYQVQSEADYPYLMSLFEPHAAAEYSFAE